LTTLPHWLGLLATATFTGQVIEGGWVSFTVMVKEQLGPAAGVHVTVVVPTG